MEKKTETKINDNGSFRKEETIRTTPEDGMVSERVTRPAATTRETRGKFHKGYTTTKTVTTNDPRVTRLVLAGFCGVFFLIGIITLVMKLWLFSAAFLSVSIFAFVKENKRINHIAQDLKKEGRDVTIDSKEELKEVAGGVTGEMKEKFEESAQETFTKEKINRFTKLTLPIYCIMAVVASVAIGILVHVGFGIAIFGLFVVIGIFYYLIFLKILVKICKKH